MKKIYLLLIAVGAILLVGCSDEGETILLNHNEKRLVSKITANEMNHANSQDWVMQFTYDTYGNLTQLLEYSIDNNNEPWKNEYTFTRSSKQLIEKKNMLFYDEELEEMDTYNETIVHTFNNKGMIVQSEQEYSDGKTVLKYIYNEAKQLIKQVQFDSLYNEENKCYEYKKQSFIKHAWSDGNLISSDYGYASSATYTYLEQKQQTNFDLVGYQSGIFDVLFAVDGYRGMVSLCCLDSESYYYTFDDEGYVHQIKEYSGGSLQCIYTFEYEESVE